MENVFSHGGTSSRCVLSTMSFDTQPATASSLLSELKDEWIEIERKRGATHFFMSWVWIESYLSSMPADKALFVSRMVSSSGGLEGIVFGGITQRRVLKLFKSNVFHAYRTGIDEIDQVWSEYGNFHTTSILDDESMSSWVDAIKMATKSEEFILYVKETTGDSSASRDSVFESNSVGWSLNLACFDGKFHSNIRRQISQTEKHFSGKGESLTLVEIKEDKCSFLQHYARWHVDKWSGTETPSGFQNSYFNSMHKNILETQEGKVAPRLFAAYVDDHVQGVVYLLQDSDWVGFYLLSAKPYKSNKIHIGTWMHSKIIKLLKDEGVKEYDFMDGDADYKRRFSCTKKFFANQLFTGKSLPIKIESTIKKLINKH